MSSPLRILFVCALNQWRSPTAEAIYRNDARLSVRSAGLRAGAKRRLSAADLAWADAVFVMEREHAQAIRQGFRDVSLPPLVSLEIADELGYMDPQLVRQLRQAIDPELSARLNA